MDLEEHTLEAVIELACAECGAPLTAGDILTSLDTGGPYLCSVHAAEDAPFDDEPVEL